jgi:hypothetical protein
LRLSNHIHPPKFLPGCPAYTDSEQPSEKPNTPKEETLNDILTNKELAVLVTLVKLLGPAADEENVNIAAIEIAYYENLAMVTALDRKRE